MELIPIPTLTDRFSRLPIVSAFNMLVEQFNFETRNRLFDIQGFYEDMIFDLLEERRAVTLNVNTLEQTATGQKVWLNIGDIYDASTNRHTGGQIQTEVFLAEDGSKGYMLLNQKQWAAKQVGNVWENDPVNQSDLMVVKGIVDRVMHTPHLTEVYFEKVFINFVTHADLQKHLIQVQTGYFPWQQVYQRYGLMDSRGR